MLEQVWNKDFKLEVKNLGRFVADIYFTESLESLLYGTEPKKMSVSICFALLNDEDNWLEEYDDKTMTQEQAEEFLKKLNEIYSSVKVVRV